MKLKDKTRFEYKKALEEANADVWSLRQALAALLVKHGGPEMKLSVSNSDLAEGYGTLEIGHSDDKGGWAFKLVRERGEFIEQAKKERK